MWYSCHWYDDARFEYKYTREALPPHHIGPTALTHTHARQSNARAYEWMDCVHVDKNDRIYLIFLSIYSPANKWASDDANHMHAELRLHPNTSPLFRCFFVAHVRERMRWTSNRREINASAVQDFILLPARCQSSMLIAHSSFVSE